MSAANNGELKRKRSATRSSPETSTAWVLRAKEASERAAELTSMDGANSGAAKDSHAANRPADPPNSILRNPTSSARTGINLPPPTLNTISLMRIVGKWEKYCTEDQNRLQAALDSIDKRDPKTASTCAKEIHDILSMAQRLHRVCVEALRGANTTLKEGFGGRGWSEDQTKQLEDLEKTMTEWTEDLHALREAGKEAGEKE